jgi:hypothetical protein
MLREGRGRLAEFRDADSLASCINYVLSNPIRKREMEKKTLAVGQTMTWDNVAGMYTRLFINSMNKFQMGLYGVSRQPLYPLVYQQHGRIPVGTSSGGIND